MRDERRRPDELRRHRPAELRQSVAAAGAALLAGAATRWLPDAPVWMLALIAAIAVGLVILAPAVRRVMIIIAAVVGALVAQLPGATVDSVPRGLLAGLLVGLVLVGPLAGRAVVDQRRAFQRRGWQLAAAESRRRAGETRAARQQERMTVAAEMHDGLGHSLTLLAVRLGQLSLSPTLGDADRREIRDVRRLAADAAGELGLTVRLLRRPEDRGAAPTPSLEDALTGARAAGVEVRADLDPELAGALSDEARNAVTRVVQEALTNAAKHAHGMPVTVAVRLADDRVTARISNPCPSVPAATSGHEGGFGLFGLRHRAALLGGDVTIERGDEAFTVTVVLPADARPRLEPLPDDDVEAAESTAGDDRSSAVRAVVALPAAVLGAALFVVVGHFALANTLSVMSPSQFERIAVGDDIAAVAPELPAMQLLDPPREEVPPRSGEDCRYYEAEISFFERTEVYVVCFADGRVSRTITVPAP